MRRIVGEPFLCTLVGAACMLSAATGLPIAGAPEPFRQTTPRVRQVHQWGCTDCDGPEQLSAIRALSVTPEGTVLVADLYPPFIRVWRRDGSLVAMFGGEGQGPAEMQSVRALSMEPGGTVSVVDTRNMRWTRFDLSGAAISSVPLRVFGNSMVFSPARRAVLSVGNAATPCATPIVRAVSVDDGGSTLLAELENVPTREPGNCPQDVYSFAAAPDGGFAVGFADPDYVIREYAPDGRLRSESHRDVPRVPKSDEELEQDRLAAERFGRELDPLRRHFYGDALRYDSAGRLWVRTARAAPGETVFDVFEGGHLVTEVSVPAATPLRGLAMFAVAGDYLLVQSPDEEGNPRVALFEIRWG